MLAGALFAADFSSRGDSDKQSRQKGFGVSSMRMFARIPGKGHKVVADRLAEKFARGNKAIHTQGVEKTSSDQKSTFIRGKEGWFLEVQNDGTKVRYRNENYIEKNKIANVSLDRRLPKEKLQKLGRDFIDSELKGYISLNEGEKLIPYFTQYEVFGSAPAKEGKAAGKEYVRSAVVVFTREIDGFPVAGPGSKVAVFFANDGTPVGFDYDWANYRASKERTKVVSKDEIMNRMNAHGRVSLKKRGVTLEKMECGYVDLGAKMRSAKGHIQPGCMFQSLERIPLGDGRETALSAHLDFIPGAERPMMEENWPAARKIIDPKAPPSAKEQMGGPKDNQKNK